MFVSDKIGFEKPDKKFFEKIMDLTKFSNDDLIMIGDSIKSDIIGAKNSKIKSIYFNKENKKISDKNFTYQVKNLSEIKKIL
ncbi:MAG: HAD family hydrolase [Anaerococcus obesiensis]